LFKEREGKNEDALELLERFKQKISQRDTKDSISVQLPEQIITGLKLNLSEKGEEVSSLQALIVGINKYHPDSGIPPLDGCVDDAINIKNFIEEYYTDRNPAIALLLDEEATYENIVENFKKITESSKAGQAILIYFSCYGSQERASLDRQRIEDSGPYDETLVCYDSRLPGHFGFANVELQLLLTKFHSDTNVTVVIDASFSFSEVRNQQRWKIKSIPSSNLLRPIPSYLNSPSQWGESGPPTVSYGKRNHLLLLASESEQVAYDKKKGGVFTQALLDTLRKNRKGTAQEVIQRTRTKIERQNIDQSPTLIAQGEDDILYYSPFLAQRNLETTKIYEANLVMLGNPMAGKTTLCRKIVDHRYQVTGDESSISGGVDITRYDFTGTGDQDFRTNIIDFPAQATLYSIDKIFYPKWSLYVLVENTRSGSAENIEAWLYKQKTYAGDSPVIIVLNEVDDQTIELEDDQLKAKYGNIAGIFRINLEDNRGLQSVIDSIQDQVAQLSHIGQEIPTSWMSIRQELNLIPNPYMAVPVFVGICQENGVNVLKQSDLTRISSYFHNLGILFHFSDDSALRDYIFLDKEWLINAIYKLLDSSIVSSSNGLLYRSKVAEVWRYDEYRDSTRQLLSLMEKFDLLIRGSRVDFGTYIVPHLLPGKRPYYDWEQNSTVRIRYHYDFLPETVFLRFLGTIQHLIKDNLLWKSGVVLADEGIAEVIAGDNTITIRVEGTNSNSFRDSIISALERVNKDFNNIKVKSTTEIPCNCSLCIKDDNPEFYDLKDLVALYIRNESKVLCPRSSEAIDINLLFTSLGFPTTGPVDIAALDQYRNSIESTDAEEVAVILRKLQEIRITNVDLSNLPLSYSPQEFIMKAIKENTPISSLRRANLSGVNLSGADLQNADLEEANLEDANLQNMNLRNARLNRAILSGANLRDADLSRCFLTDADLSYVDLQATDLYNADLEKANLQAVNLTGANLQG
ncbi:MAG: COR domain-containing protein, partial [Cyanobacteria bacterium J06649_11]